MIVYKLIEDDHHPTTADMDAEWRLGYELINVAAHDQNNEMPKFFSTYRYIGGRRMAGQVR